MSRVRVFVSMDGKNKLVICHQNLGGDVPQILAGKIFIFVYVYLIWFRNRLITDTRAPARQNYLINLLLRL